MRRDDDNLDDNPGEDDSNESIESKPTSETDDDTNAMDDSNGSTESEPASEDDSASAADSDVEADAESDADDEERRQPALALANDPEHVLRVPLASFALPRRVPDWLACRSRAAPPWNHRSTRSRAETTRAAGPAAREQDAFWKLNPLGESVSIGARRRGT